MSGMNLYRRFKAAEEFAHDLGFMFCASQYRYEENRADTISLKPRNDCLPVYSRDAELFSGAIEQVEIFLEGFAKAKMYLDMVGACPAKKVVEYENKYRAAIEKRRIKEEQKKMFNVLKNQEQV